MISIKLLWFVWQQVTTYNSTVKWTILVCNHPTLLWYLLSYLYQLFCYVLKRQEMSSTDIREKLHDSSLRFSFWNSIYQGVLWKHRLSFKIVLALKLSCGESSVMIYYYVDRSILLLLWSNVNFSSTKHIRPHSH